ncbi:hypothetical protein [Streptomyces sp. TRM 70361]|uniref:hypothetical protein n=1 Tax=Streptomyces sp. TRM 70361 TaxID=3116553 RepID=UPI003FCE84BE
MSGLSTSSPPPTGTSTPTGASFPDSPAPGSPPPVPDRAELRTAASPVSAPPLESHIRGVGASKTAPPAPSSTASSPPSAVSRTRTPPVPSRSRSSFNAALFAASDVFTTSNWVKPSAWAPIRRSTPGRTSR